MTLETTIEQHVTLDQPWYFVLVCDRDDWDTIRLFGATYDRRSAERMATRFRKELTR